MERHDFTAALRTALMQIDDMQGLRSNPLFRLLLGADGNPSPSALQRLLVDGIAGLSQAPGLNMRQVHDILYYRYVEGLGQEELAYQLGMSERQLRRKQADAIELLSNYLWERYELGKGPPTSAPGDAPTENIPSEELDWLRRDSAEAASDLQAEMSKALESAAILSQHHGVVIHPHLPPDRIVVDVPSPVLRQALLATIACAVSCASGGVIEIALTSADGAATVTLQQVSAPAQVGSGSPPDASLSPLQTISQLLAPFGGELAVATGALLRVTITLHEIETVPVLVIEDNPDTRQLLQRYAANSRFRVIATGDPEDALPLAEQSHPRVIVLDVMMPGVDGWDVLNRLRREPATHDIPVVIHTILPQTELASLLGAKAVLHKPASRETFLRVLDQWVAPKAPKHR